MKVKMYGIPNCNSVKKAKDWLKTNDISVDFHDYKKQGVNEDQLDLWLSQVSWEKLVNRAGTTWRGLAQEEKDQIVNAEMAKQLMLSKSSVIKRPLIENENGKIVVIGYNESEYDHIFANR